MRIPLDSQKYQDMFIQAECLDHAPKLKTEEDVVAFHAKHKQKLRRFDTVFASLLTLGILIYWIGNFFGGDLALLTGPVAGTVLFFGLSMALVRLTGMLGPMVAAPLDPKMCEELEVLANRSPAVASYIRKVTANQRTLRLFDVAVANKLAWGEAEAHRAAMPGTACTRLHAL